MDKLFYLNLDRSQERKSIFLENIKNTDIPVDKIERFAALDGDSYILNDTEQILFKNCDTVILPDNISNRVHCNQLGHYYMLKTIVDRGYKFAVICQDDSRFRKDAYKYIEKIAENFPQDAVLVNIGFHKTADYDFFIDWDFSQPRAQDYICIGRVMVNDYICKLKKKINPCSLAYIVSNNGARELINHFENTGFLKATDGNFNDYLESRDIFYGSIPVLCTGNDKLESTIFNLE